MGAPPSAGRTQDRAPTGARLTETVTVREHAGRLDHGTPSRNSVMCPSTLARFDPRFLKRKNSPETSSLRPDDLGRADTLVLQAE